MRAARRQAPAGELPGKPVAPVRCGAVQRGAACPITLSSRLIRNSADGLAAMPTTRLQLPCAALLVASVAFAPRGWAQGGDRFLVYFDEFSANLTQQARSVIADAAKQARDGKARAIRIEARASATGSPTANKYLAMTRSQVVADELAKDGAGPETVRQVPIGQTGSEDPSVAERRVDIVIER
jgi:outer membrane protein OmpA-like peptidoglycan-associated protein